MSATRSEPSTAGLALRIALSFALALTAAEAAELKLTFISAILAGTLAAAPGLRPATLVILPILAWLLITLTGYAVFAFARSALLFFLLLVFAALWAGFELSRSQRAAAPALLLLVFASIAPMQLLAHPEAAGVAANDIARNVLVAALAVGFVGLFLPGRPEAEDRPQIPPVAPALAAAGLTLLAFAVWTVEPPAPGAVLVGACIMLRADATPTRSIARDRLRAALAGGAAAVAVATITAVGHQLPILFLALLAFAWLFAWPVAEGGATAGLGLKSLNAMAILTAEGMSPLFEDAETRLGIRLAGVLVGLALALLLVALFPSSDPPEERESGGRA